MGAFPDEESFERLGAGDTTILGEIFRQHGTKLYAMAMRLLRHEDDAKDAVMDTLAKLWDTRQRIQNSDHIIPQLYTIHRNICLDKLRARARRGVETLDEDSLAHQYADEATLAHHDLIDAGVREFTAEDIINNMEDLSAQQKKVFLLYSLSHLNLREIGEQMGIDQRTASKYWRIARKKIYAALKKKGLAMLAAKNRLMSFVAAFF